jgi:hypothetical protein
MVSSIKYNSFKKMELFRNMNFNALVAALLIIDIRGFPAVHRTVPLRGRLCAVRPHYHMAASQGIKTESRRVCRRS